jgi:hypothetical protein
LAAVLAAPRFRLHVNRPRLGLVVRHFAGTAVDLPALSRRIPVADTYVGAFLGFELPWAAPSSVGSAP